MKTDKSPISEHKELTDGSNQQEDGAANAVPAPTLSPFPPRSEEYWMRKATREEGYNVGAGCPPTDWQPD